MKIRIAINGYGRIGRNILRALYEGYRKEEIEIIAINDSGNINVNAHLTKFDSTHGKFMGEILVKENYMIINGDKIHVFSKKDPLNLPWKDLNIDVVYECTGSFLSKKKASKHIASGAKKVIISAPGEDNDVDATIVYGINHSILTSSDCIISNGSCTTNCLATLIKPLYESIGIQKGFMTTIHAFTNDQKLNDAHHYDMRRARSAFRSLIPTKTGAAKSLHLVLPELKNRLEGISIRVPTMNVSLVDFTFFSLKKTSIYEINKIMKKASCGILSKILRYNKLPLVSIDFNHDPHSCIFDATQTKVIGNLVKVFSWYDNEWGFSNRMLDTTIALVNA